MLFLGNNIELYVLQHTHSSAVAVVAFVLVAHCPRRLRRRDIAVSVATMSQSNFLQEEYSKKYRQAANTAVLNVAIGDLVAARKNRRADGGKRLIKSNHSYKNMIALLQSVGVGITYDALMKRVARASVEDSILAEIRIPKSSAESEVSSLSPRKQAADLLTSENTATSHDNQSNPPPPRARGSNSPPLPPPVVLIFAERLHAQQR